MLLTKKQEATVLNGIYLKGLQQIYERAKKELIKDFGEELLFGKKNK